MRELTSHKVNGANERLTVNAVDGPGPGGASHHYLISGYSCEVQFSHGQSAYENSVELRFQNGAIGEVGVNGITHEALLAILIDRLEGFQGGQFANVYNDDALNHLRAAQSRLRDRTTERLLRGVEGTLKK